MASATTEQQKQSDACCESENGGRRRGILHQNSTSNYILQTGGTFLRSSTSEYILPAHRCWGLHPCCETLLTRLTALSTVLPVIPWWSWIVSHDPLGDIVTSNCNYFKPLSPFFMLNGLLLLQGTLPSYYTQTRASPHRRYLFGQPPRWRLLHSEQ